jgi:hypothetical protein
MSRSPSGRQFGLGMFVRSRGVSYALIGGVAIQIRTTEPRTTLDIDVAVPLFADVPRAALLARFREVRLSLQALDDA